MPEPGAPRPGAPRPGTWQSAHLVLRHDAPGGLYGAAVDRLLLDLLRPLLRTWGQSSAGPERPFFFVRYHDGRPHLRFRWRSEAARVGDERRELERAVAGHGSTAAPAWLVGLEWVGYEPEEERYGGPAGVALSEELFFRSSQAAVELLALVSPEPSGSTPRRPENRSARLGKGLLAQLVLLHVFEPDRSRAAELVGHYGEAYIHQRTGDATERRRWIEEYRRGLDRQSDRLGAYVEAAWSALEAEAPLTAELDPFRTHLVDLRQQLRDACGRGELVDGHGSRRWADCVRWLLPSYLHMTHNRLGIDLREECYLAVLIHATLGERARPESAPRPSASENGAEPDAEASPISSP